MAEKRSICMTHLGLHPGCFTCAVQRWLEERDGLTPYAESLVKGANNENIQM